MRKIAKASLLPLAWALVLMACGDEESGPRPPAALDVRVTLEASAEEVGFGESVTLSWTSQNAASLQLFAGELPIELGEVIGEEGSVEVTPNRTITYRLVGKGASGATATAEATVSVRFADPPSILRFGASPERFGPGAAITLEWETRGAERLTITDEEGRTLDTSAVEVDQGSITFEPKVSMRYELVAASAAGQARATASIELVPRPTARIWFETTPIEAGEVGVVHWETAGASEARLVAEGAEGSLSEELMGSLTIEPSASTTYRLEAVGEGGESVAVRTLEIIPTISSFEVDAAEALRPGSLVELSWTTAGAVAATLSNEAGWVHEIEGAEVSSGSIQAPVGKGGLFVLVATSGEQRSRPRTVSVPLTSAPRIVEARLSPEEGVVAGRGERGSLRLSWLVEGADRPLELEQIPGGPINLVAHSMRSDAVDFEVDGPTELRLVATNEAGRHELVIPAPVEQPPLIRSLEAMPPRVAAGEGVSIRWEVEDAASLRLERDGVALPADPEALSGSLEDVLATDASYVLYATNALGFEVASAPLQVELGAPLILGFGPVLATVQPGDTLEFRWENLGGTSLRLEREGGGVVCSTSSPSEVLEGGCFVPAASALGEEEFVLRVENAGGAVEERRTVRITNGPVIAAFTVDEELLVEGETLVFGWEVRAGEDEALPTLHLEDDLGRVYDLSDREVARDQKGFPIDGVGERTFTLTATAAAPEDTVQEELRVEVFRLPLIHELRATPDYVDFDSAPAEISWTSEDAVSLRIFLLEASGLPQQEASCTITAPAQVAQGSCTVFPTRSSPNVRVVATHATGAQVSKDLRIGVRPARILRFEPDHYDVLRGEGTTLRWETVHSDDRQIGPRFIEHDEPILDLMAVSGATDIFDGEYNYTTYAFPEGFKFPFFGKEIDSVCVSTKGGLNLTMPYCDTSFAEAFPHDSFGWDDAFHIAPFLTDKTERLYAERNNPDQSIWAAILTDAETGKRSLAMQWRHIKYNSFYTDYSGMDLNYQLILHEDGTLDFRYGDMVCPTESCETTLDAIPFANGAMAVIGYQDPDVTAAYAGNYLHLFPPFTAAPGGLSHRSFTLFPDRARFARFVEEAGSMEVAPEVSQDFTLLVKNAFSSDERTFRLEVHEPVVLDDPFADPAEPQPGMPVELHWSGAEINQLTILDRDDAVVFQTSDPEVLASGVYRIEGGLSRGDHRFTFRAVGNIPRDVVDKEIEVLVYEAYSLDTFETDKEFYLPGEAVTLSWSGAGLTSVTIESSLEPVVLPPVVDPNGDSITLSPSRATYYTLHAESHGRKQSLQAFARIRTVRVEEMEFSAEGMAAGGSVELSWATAGGGVISITQSPTTTSAADAYEIPGTEFVEVTGDLSKRFVDISVPGAGGSKLEEISRSPYAVTLEFPEGFRFPWFGDEKEAIRVAASGFLSWNLNENNTNYNATKYPTGNANAGNRAFLPYWQQVQTTDPGSVWWRHDPVEGSLTIQWKDWQSNTAAARPNSYDFQVVLFQDGSFEYRYGAMAANNPNYATGQTATNIGWQNPTAKIGATLSQTNQPVPNEADPESPGPANRSFRVEPFPSVGSATLRPTATTEYEICVSDESWRECRTQIVHVITAGQLVITELMVSPEGGQAEQWFELRNMSPVDLDMRGMVFEFRAASGAYVPHEIVSNEPVVIPGRGGYKVFAASPMPGVDAYVYGVEEGLELRASGSNRMLRILSAGGTQLASLNYNSLSFPAGRSLELHPNRQVFGTAAQAPGANQQASWCESEGLGTPGELGPACLETDRYLVRPWAEVPFIDLEEVPSSELPELVADAAVAPLPGGLPFSMPYFDADLAAGQPLWISSNGFSQFGELTSDWPTPRSNFPTSVRSNERDVIDQGVIAPFWVDLLPGAGASFRHAAVTRDGQQVLVLQWTGYERKNSQGRATFQSQLWENGDIVFAYRELEGGANYWGNTTNVGIEQIGSGGGHLPTQARAQAGLSQGQTIRFERLP